MSETTGICFLPVAVGPEIDDPSTEAGAEWKAAVDSINGQPGCEAVFWGREVERPSIVQIAIVWKNPGAHAAFMNGPNYEPIAKQLGSILDGDLSLYHVNFNTPFSRPASAPVTEYFVSYFPPSCDKPGFERLWDAFVQATRKDATGVRDIATGWVVEEVEHESLDGKGRCFVVAMGWESLESHRKLRESTSFKEAIVKLRNASQGRAMHHVSFKAC